MSLFNWLLRNVVGRRLPPIQGTLRVTGARASLHVHRDKWGVPYVEADTDWDAWFGLGFCHAQDRAFQLDLLLRVQRGQLAELIGAKGLPADRLARRIGFYRAGQMQLPALDDDVREILDAYVTGINAGLTEGASGRAHEHVLLRRAALPWGSDDVLGLMKLQSFLLASNWDVELARWMIYKLDGPEALHALEPAAPDWLPVTKPLGAPFGAMIDRLSEEVHALQGLVGIGGGSNNWAVRSSRTGTGRPLLANDPHLSATLPSHWYLAHLQTPDWRLAGVSFVGTPTLPAAHNDVAAWGITAGLADNTDLFIEQLSKDRANVREGDHYAPLEKHTEIIQVRGANPVKEEVFLTRRGPIITPLTPECDDAFSLCATWLKPDSVRGLLGLHRTRSFDDFRSILRDWPFGSMNMLYADTSDTIGWQFAGSVPRRRTGWGLLPGSGASSHQEWESEAVPFDDLPFSVVSGQPTGNSDGESLATANNPPLPEGTEPFLGIDFMNGYRQALILDKLRARDDWDVATSLDLQCDLESRPWREMRDVILGIKPETPTAVEALDLLRQWDGVLGIDSAGGSVFELFSMEMIRRVTSAKAPNSYQWALGKSITPLTTHNFFAARRMGHLVLLLREQPDGWFPMGWPAEIEEALAAVIERLRRDFGEDKDNWGWGRIRPLTFHHAMAQKPRLAPLFNLPTISFGGDNDTILQGSVLPLDPLAPCDNLPSARAVMDVGAWSRSRYSLPSGQSGNPFSPHYHNQFALWQKGEGIPMAWTPEEIAEAARCTLTLTPKAK